MVYTAICGRDGDRPRDDVLCFSDYGRFKDPRLNAKIYKVLAHQFIETDYSIWVDGNVCLNVQPKILVDMMGESDCAVFRHCERDNIYAEGEFIIAKHKDSESVVREQLRIYRTTGFSKSDLGMCFLIVRRHTPEIARRNAAWWAEICRYSVRDQLSFPIAFDGAVKYFPAEPIFGGHYYTRIQHGARF